jgi:hypothetical protein
MSDKSHRSTGIGFLGLLTVAFIVLKLCNIITWSWWWVLAPLWAPLVLVALVFGAAFIAILFFGK